VSFAAKLFMLLPTCVYFCCLFRYRLSHETFEYIHVLVDKLLRNILLRIVMYRILSLLPYE